MNKKMNSRISSLNPSATVELTGKIASLRNRGMEIIGFNVGEPDFDTPKNIQEAAFEAIKSGKTKYTASAGVIELREAIIEKLKKDNNVEYELDEIIVGTGAKQVLYNAICSICDEGDEVIIPTPSWVSYEEIVKISGASPRFVETDKDKGFQLNIERIERAITPNTKGVIINTPNNPTGAVYTGESLKQIAELALKYGLYIFSDEVYEKLVYEGSKHHCIVELDKRIKAQTIIINGMSKANAMTGWRIGYGAGPRDIIKLMSSLQSHSTSNVNTPTQIASITALREGKADIEIMVKEYNKRRKYALEKLNSIEGIKCDQVTGAFYLMPDISYYFSKEYKGEKIKDSHGLCKYLLEEAHVAFVPGGAFRSPNTVRMAYSNSLENIKKGLKAVEAALGRLK